ncbi:MULTISPECIES: branched-chain amino acid ABC transporter permease [Halomonadaceae]|uniref:Branched-chain amino acid ABC transporter permease n=2 Tax=Halomonadaceae TaxID=28256 RepID=A0AAP9ZEZ1_9GAMM|nr:MULTISPECIES: branched-chain amino acid ABC transporter permease [Halomonas]MBR9924556.1 branched-chain amino acid ABC transporter permease [Gammaproteobacteria bacterium]AZM94310.1 branched-chain amino acid ABC transporter permease [Halomonas venusta]MDW0359127.1 branched-chain amino acid ABC transporter permease [Halomonas venusta]MDX1714237.1 branched-chain amino acid ABC transporter permease [Halomonas venusta]NPT31714.1 branched-chain amino acid ABC transporter permease [Halomonas venu
MSHSTKNRNPAYTPKDATPEQRFPLRELVLFGALLAAVLAVYAIMGAAYSTRMLVEAACYAILALGLTIQWGYAGQFNAGVMGFVALGGFCAMLFSVPVNDAFWGTELPGELGQVLLYGMAATLIVVGVTKLDRFGVPKRLRTVLAIVIGIVLYLIVISLLREVTSQIQSQAGFIGGFGLPAWVGWIVGGALAGGVGYFIGHVCLGLRSDYLAIATLGIAEIIKAFLKNSDWLTRGTATVSPLPWPTPGPAELGFTLSRAIYLSVTAVVIAVIFFLLHRAYHAPWGRMIRAIRDNEVSSAAMGKDINKRRLEIFVLGCILMGLGGGMLGTFNSLFDPQGYLPLNHTFLVLVMVILGGPGNNLGTIFGAVAVYIIWIMSEPLALFLMQLAVTLGENAFGWEAPSNMDSRALQARVLVIGMLITLVLRFAPKGLLPEKIKTLG